MSVYKLGFISLCFFFLNWCFDVVAKRKSLVTYSFSLWPMLSFLFVTFRCGRNEASNGKSFATKLALNTTTTAAVVTVVVAAAAIAAAAIAAMATAKNERLLSFLLSFVHTKCLLDSGVANACFIPTHYLLYSRTTSAGWAAQFGLNGCLFFRWWKWICYSFCAWIVSLFVSIFAL